MTASECRLRATSDCLRSLLLDPCLPPPMENIPPPSPPPPPPAAAKAIRTLPDDPGTNDPDNPGTNDPDNPGTNDLDNPGTNNPDKVSNDPDLEFHPVSLGNTG